MDSVSKPEEPDQLTEKPNNIVAMWKRLWPLIISIGLFVLMIIVWYFPGEEHYTWLFGITTNAQYVMLAIMGVTALFISSRLLSPLEAKQSGMAWVRYIIRTLVIVVGAGAAAFISCMFFSEQDSWVAGGIALVGITIVILVGCERKRPTRFQVFIWLSSLLLLIITQYLAWIVFNRTLVIWAGPLI